MTLDQALQRIKDLEAKLDALEAEPSDGDGDEGARCPDCGAALVEGEEHVCSPKMDAAEIARLEGQRDAARKDAEDAQTTLAAVEEAHKEALAKVRKDAEDAAAKRVRESLDVLTKARAIVGKTIKLDGKDVDLLDAPLRAVKCAVIKAVKNKTVDAKKLDAYVDALFEDATEASAKGASSTAAARAVVEAPRTDAVPAEKSSVDPEKAALEKNKTRLSSAWMTETK